ncbi:alpha-hydroxy acid oxidase [Achromobacter xylosoxidans]|uniref:(S)-mandelate dehydrogenase n=1 Tax=Achromobacter aegrifaciens TaxID=1287736 RepID=A0AAD2J4I4_ACHAE|nr:MULTISPECIES: alpha-hydroxy acid oxidase [Achromobacter]MBQ2649351.1 alpha-hydroxy-acid oxidizing protein [Achromobacter sp.]MBK1982679.1 alpha-hydroxy-acid oxidizing protein [Achromobacter xylosoxidans]MCZ8438254.1 alpha-hydroxy acid oxidase [Achromobacter xylosoxidans]MDC6165473.1 alpha-hydroxy acid oxidase [Achromobacter xylosoxidans]CUJ69508.1 (S)-mandelate dehydrogenase [Achromobacter aegrifaciens]
MNHQYVQSGTVDRKETPQGARVAYSRKLESCLSLDDFELAAKRHLPTPFYQYVSGGTETNQSLRSNRSVFSDFELVPRFMVGVDNVDTSVDLLGHRYSLPFGIAPMGVAALWAYRGDTVLASAAAVENIPMMLSGASLIPLEDVRQANQRAWFQMFFPSEDAGIVALTERVRAAGYETLVITVDCPVNGNRENNARAGFSTPVRPSLRLAWQGITHPRWTAGTFLRTLFTHGMPHFENNHAHRGVPIFSASAQRDLSAAAHADWRQVKLVRELWKGKLIIKGLLDPRDAAMAAACGADGVVVSNHGGRQLDGAAAPLRVLPGIVAACPGIPVMLDSGVRRGTDVIKALALGAKFVFVGRPFAYAASVGGREGVLRAIQLLKEEVQRDMALAGRRSVGDIDKSVLYPLRGYSHQV